MNNAGLRGIDFNLSPGIGDIYKDLGVRDLSSPAMSPYFFNSIGAIRSLVSPFFPSSLWYQVC